MPVVAAGKILVTGANGFMGPWVVEALLKQNYTVLSAVRTAEKAAEMQKLFDKYGDKHSTTIVPDITQKGAYDRSVQDVDGIIHLASPFHMRAKTPAEMIEPAVGGALRLLESALEHGKSVKRVVLTSSTAAISLSTAGPHVLTENDWTDAVKICEEEGDNAAPVYKYRASKALAEQAAWKFVQEKKPSWDFVVTNPPWVFGPLYPGVPTQLNSSMSDFCDAVIHGKKDLDFLANKGAGWIDVRDNATAHIQGLQKEQAAGERILLVYDHYKWQDFINAGRKYYPELPKGNESYDPAKAVPANFFKSDKMRRILGMTSYIGIDQCTKDILDDFKARGIF